MLTMHERDVARRAQEIYDQRLKAELELKHLNAYVAIEPDSGDYFIGSSISEADDAAQKLDVGKSRVIHIGFLSRQPDPVIRSCSLFACVVAVPDAIPPSMSPCFIWALNHDVLCTMAG